MREELTFKSVTFRETETGSVVIVEQYSKIEGDSSRVEMDVLELRRFVAWVNGKTLTVVS